MAHVSIFNEKYGWSSLGHPVNDSRILQSRKGIIVSEPFARQQESINMLTLLAEKHGVKVDSADIKKMLKFAEYIKMDVESAMRILAGEQALSPEQRKKIRYLFAKEFGKVSIKVPAAELIPPEITLPPKFRELGLEESTEISYIDGLRDGKTGMVYFPINHRDKLTLNIPPSMYDHGMDEVREEINSFLSEFLRYKNKSFDLYEAEDISFDTRLGSEVPEFRTYEMELIDAVTEELRYALKYGQGKVLYKKGNLPFDRFVNTLKRKGKYEL
jgi:hypothetical protein